MCGEYIYYPTQRDKRQKGVEGAKKYTYFSLKGAAERSKKDALGGRAS